jgi:hypothetical protein
MEYEKAKSLNFACAELTTVRKAYPPVCPLVVAVSKRVTPHTHTPLDDQSS